MQQVSQYRAGERNYAKIHGDTGPLVYPAVHVYIYDALYGLTSGGADVRAAQLVFAALYLATLGTVMLCYGRARAPPWVFALLVLSKRLHSVYVLRLFNDCFAVLFLWAAVYLLQRGQGRAAAVVFSVGLGVKMSLLLALPGVAVVLYLLEGPWWAALSVLAMAQLQVWVGWPFLVEYPREYIGRAFEFSRVFLFKWTVNWRFLGEEAFLSQEFSVVLLLAHIGLLALFGLTRWIKPSGTNIMGVAKSFVWPPDKRVQRLAASRVTSDFVLSTVLGANVIGMLCARSLHYQFFSWLAWGTPYLLWRSGLHPVGVVAVWAAQELAWNIYPSTGWSSGLVVGCLAVQVAGLWVGTARPAPAAKRRVHEQ